MNYKKKLPRIFSEALGYLYTIRDMAIIYINDILSFCLVFIRFFLFVLIKKNCRYFYRQLVIEATRSSVRYYSYWNKDSIFCLEAFACANIAIDACCKTCVLARLDVSDAKSASSILPFAVARFVAIF